MEVKSNYLKGCRLRMFAGPNGSGKSTIFNQISKNFDTGIYLNADNLEKELKLKSKIDLAKFIDLKDLNKEYFYNFIENHSLYKKAKNENYPLTLELENTYLKSFSPNSYESALIVDFIRTILINQNKKISFETVMSHKSKIDVLNLAKSKGYKTYLYFVGTESEEINISRVEQRVKLDGHYVSKDKIIERYYKSLNLLKKAVKSSFRSFIFDNSGIKSKLILEVEEGKIVIYHDSKIPKWVDKYLLS